MTDLLSPEHYFELWLPGELEYSARKAGYDQKIERAKKPITDMQSIYGFLGGEWFTFQHLRDAGVHHMSFHGSCAQQKLAKFAAGMFDKVGLGLWLESCQPATEENFVSASRIAAGTALTTKPWSGFGAEAMRQLELDFEQTIFAEGIAEIMALIEAGSHNNAADALIDSAMRMGGLATACYIEYAKSDLTPDQYEIPASQAA